MPAWARRVRILGVSLAAGLVLAAGARADTLFLVDSTLDQIDDDTVDITCHTAANTCTLRAAVMQANRLSGTTTIVLPAGTYLLTRLPSGGNGDDSGDLNLTTPASGNPVITISGSGRSSTIVDANQLDRVFRVHTGRSASISGVTLRNGLVAGGGGGGIKNNGTLAVSYCTLSGNASAFGGGIDHQGPSLTLSHSTLSGNVAASGGGIYADSSATDVSQSTISGNAADLGGGINNQGVLYLTNSTISRNDSDGDGGGIYSYGTTWTYNATIVGNQADADADVGGGNGGGVFNEPGSTFNLRNSVVAGNFRAGAPDYTDCAGNVGSFGRNKLSTFDGCTLTQLNPNGDFTLIGSLSELGPLQFNGRSTRTHALLAPSDMIDGANATAGCQDRFGSLLVDQQGSARGTGALCDLGAFESGALPPGSLFADGFELGNLWAW